MNQTIRKNLTAFILLTTISMNLTSCVSYQNQLDYESMDILEMLDSNSEDSDSEEESQEDVPTFSTLEQELEVPGESFTLLCQYSPYEYKSSVWRVTENKLLSITAKTSGADGKQVFIKNVYMTLSLKSNRAKVEGLTHQIQTDSYIGVEQEGFYLTDDIPYQTFFRIQGINESFVLNCESISLEGGSLSENNLQYSGGVYAEKVQIIYELAIKEEGSEYFRTVSVVSEFIIPSIKNATTSTTEELTSRTESNKSKVNGNIDTVN